MLYLKLPVRQQCVILGYEDRDHSFFKQYMEIRDFHYVQKNAWEPQGGEDVYDQHSKFLLVVTEGRVTSGCRIIHDVIGLPIRELLEEEGLPTEQVPFGSTEVSRFGVHPEVLKSRSAIENVKCIALALETYFKLFDVTTSYAVLISVLENMLVKFGVHIERLPQPVVTHHGESVFNTVKFLANTKQDQTQTVLIQAQQA